ncbi:MAG: HAD family hydrolase [Desulfobacca sp.]|uniref:HAD family hydrolase n=1 Tax=Desulfobacca sp. TaxID=2067990 RepID=UPI004049ADFA
MPGRPENTIDLITFDLGNVLVRVDHLEFCRRLAELAHINPETVFTEVFASDLEPAFDTGKISAQEFFVQITSRFQVSLSFHTFCSWWNSIFAPMPEMVPVVEHLASRYPLFLLSNTNALHFQYIREQYPLLNNFRQFVLSFKVGYRKPEPEIYRRLIHQAHTPPARILFIDDKLPFVAAARDQGLQAWQFTVRDRLVQQLQEVGAW